ncbi:MAG: hypothetical protein KC457_01960 [Myxococcales bacterium]|nr:hypothetical protein [Myxococcales bacterium]
MRVLASPSLPALTMLLGLALACVDEPPELTGAGGSCEYNQDCEDPLVCFESVCVDDTGPALDMSIPSPLAATTPGGGLFAYVHIPGRDPDQRVEFSFDPFGPSPTSTILEWAGNDFPEYSGLTLEAPLEPGAHWLRGRVLDGALQPYENPSATQYVLIFVRDPVHPDKPMVGMLEPRPDRRHRAGTPLPYSIAVLPGSFIFSTYGGVCEPLPDCADPFAPECEDECGPISRSGRAHLYLDEELPDCFAAGCFGNYVDGLEGQDDAYIVHGHVHESNFAEPGLHELSAVLFYDYTPYPSASAPIYTTQTLEVIAE